MPAMPVFPDLFVFSKLHGAICVDAILPRTFLPPPERHTIAPTADLVVISHEV